MQSKVRSVQGSGAYLDEPVTYLPAEDAWVRLLVVLDALLHLGGCYPRLTTPYNSGADAASLLVTIQYLGHTAM